jgi:mannose-1-phosphate guanylyltransferase
MTVKGIILAAGEGIRLRPITANLPKCLVPVQGKPLLGHWLDQCQAGGIDEVYINGFYLAEQVAVFLKLVQPRYRMKIHFCREEQLTGTGGFMRKLYDKVKDDDFFFFCHGDNFTDLDIADFITFHCARKSKLTMAMFKTENPTQCGIVEKLSSDGVIEVFREKPFDPQSDRASAAIFLMSPSIIQSFPAKQEINFSKEVLPDWQGRMYGYMIKGFNIDIGTPETLVKANNMMVK